MIAVVDRNWGIGKNGRLLVHLPSDLKFFKENTYGKTVVMGRKTFESLPGGKPLKGRMNIVMTRQLSYDAKGAVTVQDKNEILSLLKGCDTDDIYIIGGAEIFGLMMDFCDEALITKIDGSFDADTYFPDLDRDTDWEVPEIIGRSTDNGYDLMFLRYRKKSLPADL